MIFIPSPPPIKPLHHLLLPLYIAPSLWNAHLGHPGAPVFDSLRLNKFIECNQTRSSHVHSCSLGKHVKLPFVSSHSYTMIPFDIIHSDI